MTRSIARHFAFDDHKKSHCRKITTQRQQFADEVVTRYIGIPSSGHFQNLIQQEFPRQETQNYANIVPIFLGGREVGQTSPLILADRETVSENLVLVNILIWSKYGSLYHSISQVNQQQPLNPLQRRVLLQF